METCEFCLAISKGKTTRFSDVYPNLTSRIVAETDHFVAMPAIGQLFKGSLLILPRTHVETTAKLDPQRREELILFLDSLTRILQNIGNPVCFEHGALSCTGGGCGIYHAHLHLVPLPRQIKPEQFFPEFTGRSLSLGVALDRFNHCDEYLLFGDGTAFVHAAVEELPVRPQSQFFRKRLADYFGLVKSWDWRHYVEKEPYMLETIEYFQQTQGGIGLDCQRIVTL